MRCAAITAVMLLAGCSKQDGSGEEGSTGIGPADTGEPTTGSMEGGHEPTTGADTREPKILFVSNRSGAPQLFWMNPDGTGQVPISSGTSMGTKPGWTRSGANVLFTRDGDVWLLRPESGVETNLTPTTVDASDVFSAVGPDGAWFVYADLNMAGWSNLFRAPTSGGVPSMLTSVTVSANYEVAVSPDGQQLAVVARPMFAAVQFAVLDAVTGKITQDLLTPLGLTGVDSVGWSPDGAQLVFDGAVGDEDPGIFVVKPDATGLLQLDTARQVARPVWAPDGQRIAYYRAGPDENDSGWRVFVVGRDGGVPTFVSTEGWSCYLPDWSPDSTQLVFQCGTDDQVGENIHTVAAEGGPLTRLTADAGSNQLAKWRP